MFDIGIRAADRKIEAGIVALAVRVLVTIEVETALDRAEIIVERRTVATVDADGVTVVMVAHDVNPIIGALDRVVYIAAGGVASGSPRDVITSQTLTRLYGTPVEVLTTSDGRLVVVGTPEAPAHHSDRHVH